MTGHLYGIGVGPGDPELMTIKAVKLLKSCPVIAIPAKDKAHCTAYKIAVQAVPELNEKELLCLSMPMSKDEEALRKSHEEAADRVAACLGQGKDVGFITLGDASVYSTYLYVHERILKAGYPARIVSGIPSFCAAAARLNEGLVNGGEELHVLPASYGAEAALKLSGVKVLMKAGREMKNVKKVLETGNYTVKMVENCGMENEKIFDGLTQIPDDAGYFSLLIVKDREEN